MPLAVEVILPALQGAFCPWPVQYNRPRHPGGKSLPRLVLNRKICRKTYRKLYNQSGEIAFSVPRNRADAGKLRVSGGIAPGECRWQAFPDAPRGFRSSIRDKSRQAGLRANGGRLGLKTMGSPQGIRLFRLPYSTTG